MRKKLGLIVFIGGVVVIIVVVSGLLPQFTKHVTRNEEISVRVRNEINNLNNQVLKAVKKRQFQKFYSFCTSEFKQSIKQNLSSFTPSFIKLQKIISKYKVKNYEAYHITLYQLKNNNQLKLKIESGLAEKPVILKLDSVNSNMYVAFLKTSGWSIKHLLALVYVKQNGKWKLSNLNCRDYAYYNQTALDYYHQAKKLAENDFIISAYLYTAVAEELSPPSNFLNYNRSFKLNQLGNNLSKKIANQLSYPIEVTSLTTNPEIFTVKAKNLKKGLAAVIKYKTSVSLDQPQQLHAEANKLTKQISHIFPGIKTNFNYLAYQIYAKSNSKGNYYGIVVNLNKEKTN